MPDPRPVVVRYTKWGGGPHWRMEMVHLGTDAHGTWLAAPPGSVLQLRDEPPVTRRHWFVALVPGDGNWIALWHETSRCEIYVDVTDRPVWSPDGTEVTAADLDLDVIRWRPDGSTQVWDEDEFAEHQLTLAYPPDLVAEARTTADRLVAAVDARHEPFDRVGPLWLARATGSFDVPAPAG